VTHTHTHVCVEDHTLDLETASPLVVSLLAYVSVCVSELTLVVRCVEDIRSLVRYLIPVRTVCVRVYSTYAARCRPNTHRTTRQHTRRMVKYEVFHIHNMIRDEVVRTRMIRGEVLHTHAARSRRGHPNRLDAARSGVRSSTHTARSEMMTSKHAHKRRMESYADRTIGVVVVVWGLVNTRRTSVGLTQACTHRRCTRTVGVRMGFYKHTPQGVRSYTCTHTARGGWGFTNTHRTRGEILQTPSHERGQGVTPHDQGEVLHAVRTIGGEVVHKRTGSLGEQNCPHPPHSHPHTRS
jgi:hypothetical protein